MLNKIGHVDFLTTDFNLTIFFNKLFGWKFKILKEWDYIWMPPRTLGKREEVESLKQNPKKNSKTVTCQ